MADDDIPNPQRLIKLARQTLSSSERRRKFRRIDFLDTSFWYPTQLQFFAEGGRGVHARLLYGGNQTGKTLACSAETSWHLTGQYPDWWVGKRFRKPIRCWAVGESSTLVRDSLQRQLCGALDFGSGTIPLESFSKKPVMVPGGTGAIDSIFITHQTDGHIDGASHLTFKSFEQQRAKLASESLDLVWIDERPNEEVFGELYARTIATDGHIIVSFTPIGEGAAAGVTYRFLSEPSADRSVHRISGEEARHISASRREELIAGIPEHEQQTRLEGVPQLGTGPVFPIELLPGLVRSISPDEIFSWARRCVGIDFGFTYPFAAVYIAWAHDTGQIWVIDSFSMARSSALYHVQRIHSMTQGLRIPIAWPHDGAAHDKGSGLPLASQYKNFGANMMAKHVTNHGTNNYNIEPALEELRELMFTGKLIIAGHNHELLEELRHYHRSEDFKVVAQRDDLVSALRYAVMARRQGKPISDCDGVGYGNMPYAGQRRVPREPSVNNDNWDIFTGR
jgi:phage terminase large subunit-like protein